LVTVCCLSGVLVLWSKAARSVEKLQSRSVEEIPSTSVGEIGVSSVVSLATALEVVAASSDVAAKKKLWWNLTQELAQTHGFPIGKHGATSSLRRSLDLWDQQIASRHVAVGSASLQCAETGDGHFLRNHFKEICKTSLVVDKFDQRADVKLDLSLRPNLAPQSIKDVHKTIDLLVSHQVFEHLQRPSVGMANLNALLRIGGKLVFSTPFIVQDHQGPTDFFRYTVKSIHTLLTCAGFTIEKLHGLGDRLEDLAYIAEVPSDMLAARDLVTVCDGMEGCNNKYYAGVASISHKVADVTLEEIRECWG